MTPISVYSFLLLICHTAGGMSKYMPTVALLDLAQSCE